jgi:hypothetical protein
MGIEWRTADSSAALRNDKQKDKQRQNQKSNAEVLPLRQAQGEKDEV